MNNNFELMKVNKKAEFKEKIKNHENVIVKFYSNKCGHCRLLEDKHYEKMNLDKDLKDLNLKFLNVEVNESDEELLNNLEFKLAAVPTVALYKQSTLLNSRTGADVDGIVTFVKENFSKNGLSKKDDEDMGAYRGCKIPPKKDKTEDSTGCKISNPPKKNDKGKGDGCKV